MYLYFKKGQCFLRGIINRESIYNSSRVTFLIRIIELYR